MGVFSTTFAEAVLSTAEGKKQAKGAWLKLQKAWTGAVESKRDDLLETWIEGLYTEMWRIIMADENTHGVDSAITFVRQLVLAVPAGPEDFKETCLEIVEQTMLNLLGEGCTVLKEPVQRLRAVQLLWSALSALPAFVCEDTAPVCIAAIKERFHDKKADIRKVAVQAASKLMADEDGAVDGNSPLLPDLIKLLADEQHQGVRTTIVAYFPISEDTIDTLLERTLDVAHEVRATVFKRFQAVPMDALLLEHRTLLLRRGLRDRHESVRKAAQALLAHWLAHSCDSKPEAMLQLLDVQNHTEEAELALDGLAAHGALDCVATLRSCGLRAQAVAAAAGQATEHLSAETAFLWRFAALRLQKSATERGLAAAATFGAAAQLEAAEATNRHDVLDSVLPEAADHMTALVACHCTGARTQRFVACQLLQMATSCMEWTDIVSRQAGQQLVETLLRCDPRLEPAGNSASALAGCGGSGAWEAAVVEFACRVQPGGAQEFGPAMLGSLQHVATEWGVDRLADGGGSPAAWLQVVAYVRQVLQFAARTQVHTSLVQDKQQGAWLLAMLQAACTHEGLGVRVAGVRGLGLLASTPSFRRDAFGPAVAAAVTVLKGTAVSSKGAAPLQAAAEVLQDLMVLYGLPAVEDAGWGPQLQVPGSIGSQGGMERLVGQLAGVQLGAGGSNGAVSGLGEQQDVGDAEAGQQSAGGHGKDQGELEPRTVAPADMPRTKRCLQLLQETLELVVKQQEDAAKEVDNEEELEGSGSSSRRESPLGSLARTLIEGLSRMVMFQGVHKQLSEMQGKPHSKLGLTDDEARSVLTQLLKVHIHPATEALPAARQCLTVFFEAYCGRTWHNKGRLARSLMPAARHAKDMSAGPRKTLAPALIKFAVTLLNLPCAEGGAGGDAGIEELAMEITKRLHSMRDTVTVQEKAYYAELAMALAQLPLRSSEVKVLSTCAGMLRRLPDHGRTTALGKGLHAARTQLEDLLKDAAKPSQEEVEAEIERLLASLPADEEQAQPQPKAKRSTGSRAAAKGAAKGRSAGRGGRRAAARDDDNEEEEDSTDDSDPDASDDDDTRGQREVMHRAAPVAQRKQPARSAATRTRSRVQQQVAGEESD